MELAPGKSRERLLARALPDYLAAIVGTDEVESVRRRISASPPDDGALLGPSDFLEATAILALVVLATLPVRPFVFMQNSVNAFRLSQGITLAMLFPAGTAFGRYAEHPKPMRTGIAISVFGAVPIAVVKALGR